MIRQMRASWDEFWFQPASANRVKQLRIGVLTVVLLWFASFFGNIAYWFGSDGVLSLDASARILDFAQVSRWQRWSFLWLSDSLALYYACLVAGIVLSVVAALGLGGRIVYALLLVVAVSWIHRITWLSGPVEPLLVPLVIYLAVASSSRTSRSAPDGPSSSYWNNIALRLTQVHIWIVLAAGFLSQLANLVWWRGEAIWWLASSGRSQMLSLQLLGDNPLLVEFITHGILVVQAVSLMALLQRPFRPLGVIAGWLFCLAMCVFWCQPLYAALLAVALIAFLPERRETRAAAA